MQQCWGFPDTEDLHYAARLTELSRDSCCFVLHCSSETSCSPKTTVCQEPRAAAWQAGLESCGLKAACLSAKQDAGKPKEQRGGVCVVESNRQLGELKGRHSLTWEELKLKAGRDQVQNSLAWGGSLANNQWYLLNNGNGEC